MNDRFRFRVWNTRTKKLREVAQITLDARQHGRTSEISNMETCHLAYQPHLVLEQCTGLKDKHGRLIYEGDILKGSNGSVNGSLCEFTWVVKWLKQKARFYLPVWAYDKDGNYSDDWSHWFEVVGNIHENADLLEGSK